MHILILIAARQLLDGNSHYHRSITLFSFVDAAQHRSVTDPSSYRVCLCSQSPSIPPCVSDVLVWSQRPRILTQDILTDSDTDSSLCIHGSFLVPTGAQGVTMRICLFVPAVLSCQKLCKNLSQVCKLSQFTLLFSLSLKYFVLFLLIAANTGQERYGAATLFIIHAQYLALLIFNLKLQSCAIDSSDNLSKYP